MTVFFVVLGFAALGISLTLFVAITKAIARQLNVDDCLPDWEDCV